MPTATGRLRIGGRIYMTWPEQQAALFEAGLIEIDLLDAHAKQPTFKLKAPLLLSEHDLSMVLEATTARSLSAAYTTWEDKPNVDQ